jgi:ABC-type polysaccharide transport system, permease component
MDSPLVKKSFGQNIRLYRNYYIMLMPAVILIFIFCYLPMYGVVISFQDYKIGKGISGSEWVGLKQFKILFTSSSFYVVLRNTLLISLYKIIALTVCPILLALMLNEIINQKFKKVVQTISYLPHFLSWVVIGGVMIEILSPERGIVNYVIQLFGGTPLYFLAKPEWFRSIVVLSAIWAEVGWGSIIYIASISSIDIQTYEAAKIDGANRLKQAIHITLPSIYSVIVVMLILSIGGIMSAGFDQIFNMYSPLVYSTGDIIDTYIYRYGFGGTGTTGSVQINYSLSTAVGLFKNIIGFIMLFGANIVSKKISDYGVW